MDTKLTVEAGGIASAQLARPDAAQAKWLAFPLAAMAWGITSASAHRVVAPWAAQPWTLADVEPETVVLVDQLADFDAWRVGGGVAFRW